VEDSALHLLATIAEGQGVGARLLERTIEEQVLLPLSEKRLNGQLKAKICLSAENEQIHLEA